MLSECCSHCDPQVCERDSCSCACHDTPSAAWRRLVVHDAGVVALVDCERHRHASAASVRLWLLDKLVGVWAWWKFG